MKNFIRKPEPEILSPLEEIVESKRVVQQLEALSGLLERKVIFLGLEGSGKTYLLTNHQKYDKVKTKPTTGFNLEIFQVGLSKLSIFDVGGKIRSLWKQYFKQKLENDKMIYCPIVYIIDASSKDKVTESLQALNENILEENKTSTILLVLNRYFNGPSIESFISLHHISDLLKDVDWKIMEINENGDLTQVLNELDIIIRNGNKYC